MTVKKKTKKTPKKEPKKSGPKFIEIDRVKLEQLCRMGARLKDSAEFLEVSEDTIERFCKRIGFKSYADFRNRSFVATRLAIKQKLIAKAIDQDNLKAQMYLAEKMGIFESEVAQGKDDFIEAESSVLRLAYNLETLGK